jgi:hypothetical protein
MRTLAPGCVLGLALLAAALTGCGGSAPSGRPADARPEAAGPKEGAKATGDKEGRGGWDKESPKDGGRRDAEAAERAEPRRAAMDEARVGMDRTPRARPPQELPAGVLTAGSFDDNLYPEYFRRFASRAGQNPYVADLPGRLTGPRLEVVVANGEGAPVGNARVRLRAAAGGRSVELTTRSDGRAVFLPEWDGVAGGDFEVTAALPGGAAVTRRAGRDEARCAVVLPEAPAPLPRNLDLAFVLDTTGSMGDELAFLKAEIKGIAADVRARFPQVRTRYALVCYRDEGMGDAYVTRVFDFTADLDEFQRNLAAQSAAGGGDLPEAMHKGLEDATRLGWREADTARVLFLVADAPPHARDAAATLGHVDALRRKGVSVYGVAASCNEPAGTEATEFFLRAASLLTGGQYLFLTDDSGVGEAHGEPHIPFYQVEKLNRLMARMIAGELAGRRLEAEPKDVLRAVGAPPRQDPQRR